MVSPFIRKYYGFLALFAFTSACWAQDLSITDLDRKSYGPNMDLRVLGSSAVVPGVWIPQGTTTLQYTFLEPLNDMVLGTPARLDARFLRVGIAAHLSPWFGMFETQLGIRALPRLEFGFNYQVLSYFNSNVGQAMNNEGSGQTLKDTWNSDYYFEHLYDGKFRSEYSQVFGFVAGLDLGTKLWLGGAEYRFFLIDIRTVNSGKNLDFPRMLPVHKRDFFFETQVWLKKPLSPQWIVGMEFNYQQTGFLSRSFGIYDKEPVQQIIAYANVFRLFERGKHDFSISPGFFWRPEEVSAGNAAEHILVRALWQTHWNWVRD